MKKIIQINRFMVMLVAMFTLSLTNAFATDYTSLFSINCTSVVTDGTYQAYTATVDQRGWVVTFGGGSSTHSVATNSGNRSKCVLGDTYAKYAITNLVSKTDIATAFVSTTSISDVSKISYTFNGGSNQTATKVYLIYSSNNTTFDTIPLISGTQGAAIASGTAYTFAKKTGYFGLLFKCTNSTGNWRIDNVEITFYAEPDMHDFLYFVGLNGNDTVRLNKYASTSKNLEKLTATFEYSKDRINWKAYDTWGTYDDPVSRKALGAAIELAKDDTVFFRAKGTNGKNATMSNSGLSHFIFAFGDDDQIAAGGNTMSLYDATCEQDTMTDFGFINLFLGAKQLVSASELKLPATKLAQKCYQNMFTGCTSLTAVPELKATTLADRCYFGMFARCTSLQVDTCADGSCDGVKFEPTTTGTAPTGWNNGMFDGCKGTVTTPQLNGHYCIKEAKKYKITTSVNLSSRGYTTGDTTAFYGDTVIISAEAYYGYHFVRWDDYYEDNPRKVVVTKDTNYQATFSKNKYELTVSANGPGSVTGGGSYSYNSKNTITATPDPNCQFIQWNDGNTDNPRVITLTQDTALVAQFEADKIPYVKADGTVDSCATYIIVEDATEQVTWNAGWYVVNGTVTLDAGAVCNGAINLILADGADLTATGTGANAGIEVSGTGTTLTIYGQTDMTGKLYASCVSEYACAIGLNGTTQATGDGIYVAGSEWTITADDEAVPFTTTEDITSDLLNKLVVTIEKLEVPTSVQSIRGKNADQPVKFIENGQLLIIRNGKMFNAQGAAVE